VIVLNKRFGQQIPAVRFKSSFCAGFLAVLDRLPLVAVQSRKKQQQKTAGFPLPSGLRKTLQEKQYTFRRNKIAAKFKSVQV